MSSHSSQDSLLGSPVTSSPSPPPDAFGGDMHPPLWPRLFAEPLPTVEQMDAFWNGGEDDDEEEEEEEERLPDYVQPIRGEPYKDYLAWHKAGFDKLRQAKVAADEWMAVAARDACDLMQQAKDGNTFALDKVKHRLHGAIGKKQKLSEFDACIVAEWRVPGRDNAARNEAKCCRCFAAYKTAKATKKPPTASPHCPPQPASTLLTHITSPGLTPLESTPPEPMPHEPTSQPTHKPVPHKPTPEPTPREPTPEPAPHEPTPEPVPHEHTPEPAPCEPTPEPAPYEPTPEPAPCEPTPEPAPCEPTPKPTPHKPTPEPTPCKPTPESSPQESFLRESTLPPSMPAPIAQKEPLCSPSLIVSLSPNSYFLELEDMGGSSD
ncbi:hypothetical protein BS47DRAFT_1402293 [Hydnum rufescens UP504]|uniref:Uncharacterized protein n=1 Tax=Hydnum rufescens UP504 TaxID=1448309 RepID=A0A9P6ACT0_9AGAM|nr:hypothetical protein BS47DRAFT_1402293 [Hydnum rufescens UP504]